jgi:RHS repeat-associated protein
MTIKRERKLKTGGGLIETTTVTELGAEGAVMRTCVDSAERHPGGALAQRSRVLSEGGATLSDGLVNKYNGFGEVTDRGPLGSPDGDLHYDYHDSGWLKSVSDSRSACNQAEMTVTYGTEAHDFGKVKTVSYQPSGIVRHYDYSPKGLLEWVYHSRTEPAPADNIGTKLGRYHLIYDTKDRIESVSASELPGGDSYTEKYGYDDQDHLTYLERSSADGLSARSLGYDKAHNIVKEVEYSGLVSLTIDQSEGGYSGDPVLASQVPITTSQTEGAVGTISSGLDLGTSAGSLPVRIEVTIEASGQVLSRLKVGDQYKDLPEIDGLNSNLPVMLETFVVCDGTLVAMAWQPSTDSTRPRAGEVWLRAELPGPVVTSVTPSTEADGGVGAASFGVLSITVLPPEGAEATIHRKYDGHHRLTQQIDADQSEHRFDYSPGGLLRHIRHLGDQFQTDFDYDRLDRLVKFSAPDDIELSNQYYGASWQRSRQILAEDGHVSRDERFRWLGGGIHSLEDAHSGDRSELAYHGLSPLWQGVQDADGSRLETFVKNHRGDIVGHYRSVPESQGLAFWQRFGAFGTIEASAEVDAGGELTTAQPARGPGYRGYWYDGIDSETTGAVYHLQNRSYLSGLGRFAQVDPAKDGVNWYAYCDGDPVNRADPSGLDWEYVDGVEGVVRGSWWDTTTSGHWRYIPGTDPFVQKPRDDITPKMLGLSGNRLTQADVDREMAKPAMGMPWSDTRNGYFIQDTRYFEQARVVGGTSIEYGPKASRQKLNIPEGVTAEQVMAGFRVALASTVVDASRDLTPVFFLDRGSALVAGSSPFRTEADQLTRGQAATEFVLVGVTAGTVRYGMRTIDTSATRMVGLGPTSRPLSAETRAVLMPPPPNRLANVNLARLGDGPNLLLVPEMELSVASAAGAKGQYSNVFQFSLPVAEWGTSSARHMRLATEALHLELRANPQMAAAFEQAFPGISQAVAPGARGGFQAVIPGFTWQHATSGQAGAPGFLQLVPRYQHTNPSPWWDALHPGGAGGFAEWAAPLGARR